MELGRVPPGEAWAASVKLREGCRPIGPKEEKLTSSCNGEISLVFAVSNEGVGESEGLVSSE